MVLDAEFRVACVNRAIEQCFGVPREELLGRDVRMLVPERIAAAFAANEDFQRRVLATYADNTYVEHFECLALSRGDLGERWYEHNSRPITTGPYAGGRIEHYHDITERKRAETALRASEERYRSLVESTPIGIIVHSDNHIAFANVEAARLLGADTPDRLLGMAVTELVHPSVRTEVQRQLAEMYESGRPTPRAVRKLLRLDGGEVDVEIIRLPIELAGKRAVQTVLRDLAEQKRAERAQRESDEKFQAIVTHSQPIVFMIDKDGTFSLSEGKMLSRLGLAPGEVVGRSAFELYADHPRVLRGLRAALHGAFLEDTVEINGSLFDVFYSPRFDSDGTPNGLIGMAVDVTDRKRAEAERERHVHYLESVRKVSDAIEHTLNLQEMMHRVIGVVREIFDCDRAWLMYPCDPYAPAWRVPVEITTVDWPGAFAEGGEFTLDAPSRRILKTVLESECPVTYGAQGDFPLRTTESERFHVRSQIMMALRPRTGNAWALGMHQCAFDRQWTGDEKSLFADIARRVGDALNNLLLHEELRQSEQRFRTVSEHAGDAVILSDNNGRILFWNDAAERVFGYTANEIVGNNLVRLIPPRLQNRHESGMEAWRRGQSSPLAGKSFEAVGLHRDGNEVPIEISLGSWNVGDKTHAAAIVRDISQRKAAENAAAARARQQEAVAELGRRALAGSSLRDLFQEAVTCVATTLDIEFCKVLESRPEQDNLVLRAHVGFDVTDTESVSVSARNDSQAGYTLTCDAPVIVEDLRSETRFSGPILLRDHGVVSGMSVVIAGWQRPWGVFGAHSTRPRVFCKDDVNFLTSVANVLADAIRRRQAEEENARLALAIEQSAEAVIITDAQGLIQYVNPAYERVSGYQRSEVIGQSPLVLENGQHEAEFYRELWKTISEGKAWSGRLVSRRKDGAQFEEDATISPVRDETGRITNFVAVKRDVTRELELESQLRQSQKMEAIGRLAGGVAHDFNNILTVILGNVELMRVVLERGAPDPPELVADLDQIDHAAQRAASLTRQLLAFGRRQVINPERIDLNRLLTDMQQMLRRLIREDIELVIAPAESLWRLHADAGQIEQVLINLVVNARDAMDAGGTLTIATSNRTLDDDYVARHSDANTGPHVCISVRDTGIGIDEQTFPRLFEPFFTTKPIGQGSGLGLATVHGIVRQSNGHITVESAPGRGAEFCVYLPATTSRKVARESAEVDSSTAGRGETILLCEDNESVRAITRRALERGGYTVLEAGGTDEALALAAAHDAGIDLLLTDVIMPHRNGRELAELLTAQRPGLRVLFVSGYAMEVIGRRGVLRDGVEFLEKPYTTQRLLQRVREVLDRGRDS